MIYLYNLYNEILSKVYLESIDDDLLWILQLWNDHLPHIEKKYIYIYISIHMQLIPLDQDTWGFVVHLLLPSSRLWNAYIQSRGCDWWRDEDGFIPTAKEEPQINRWSPRGARQINKERFVFFVFSVAGRTIWEPYKRDFFLIIHSVLHTFMYKHITQAAFTPHSCVCSPWALSCATKNPNSWKREVLIWHCLQLGEVSYLWSTKWLFNSWL